MMKFYSCCTTIFVLLHLIVVAFAQDGNQSKTSNGSEGTKDGAVIVAELPAYIPQSSPSSSAENTDGVQNTRNSDLGQIAESNIGFDQTLLRELKFDSIDGGVMIDEVPPVPHQQEYMVPQMETCQYVFNVPLMETRSMDIDCGGGRDSEDVRDLQEKLMYQQSQITNMDVMLQSLRDEMQKFIRRTDDEDDLEIESRSASGLVEEFTAKLQLKVRALEEELHALKQERNTLIFERDELQTVNVNLGIERSEKERKLESLEVTLTEKNSKLVEVTNANWVLRRNFQMCRSNRQRVCRQCKRREKTKTVSASFISLRSSGDPPSSDDPPTGYPTSVNSRRRINHSNDVPTDSTTDADESITDSSHASAPLSCLTTKCEVKCKSDEIESPQKCGRIVEVEHPTLVRDTENLLEHAMWWKDFSPGVNSTTVWSMDDSTTKPRKVRKRRRKKRNASNKIIYEYADQESFCSGDERKMITLPAPLLNYGAVIHDGCLYYLYNKRKNTQRVARYHLRKGTILKESAIKGPSRDNGDVKFAVDESGVWLIFQSRRKGLNQISISHLNVESDDIKQDERHHYTMIPVNEVGNSFIACGILYTVASNSIFESRINYSYDLATGIKTKLDIPFYNAFESTSMISYNPNEKLLMSWDNGRQLTYKLRFDGETLAHK